ncbi:hypothetical protein SNE40_021374 [Patella caerulea]|uniref:EF-hand domain-containing protein n=1 Tax=Patella caerulea TaxID=87958 RepID=A0AAN8GIM5_PATCE
MNSLSFIVCFSLVSLSVGLTFVQLDINNNNKLTKAEFKGLLVVYDLNGDNEITLKEIMASTNLNSAQAQAILNKYDTNADGKVHDIELNDIFDRSDLNQDKELSLAEFNAIDATDTTKATATGVAAGPMDVAAGPMAVALAIPAAVAIPAAAAIPASTAMPPV